MYSDAGLEEGGFVCGQICCQFILNSFIVQRTAAVLPSPLLCARTELDTTGAGSQHQSLKADLRRTAPAVYLEMSSSVRSAASAWL
ncbi:hypothetical protein AOLI_G00177540 [Acnodon oligacanthus]